MAEGLTLVIDQGTHATRALAVDGRGRIVDGARRAVALVRHDADHIEQDAAEIAATVEQVVAELLASDAVRGHEFRGAALATQRSSVVAWDRRSGEPLAPMISWQDRRAADAVARLETRLDEVRERSGLMLSPHYGASKLRWLLDEVPAVAAAERAGILAYGPLAAFVLFHLLRDRPLVVDHANAARTQLWNLATREWDPDLLELFDVPPGPLPATAPIRQDYGRLAAADIPLLAANGDQNAALWALGRPAPGSAIVNIGTGAFVLLPTGPDLVRHPRLLSSLASSDATHGEYTLEGTVNGAGAALTWAEEQWGLPSPHQYLPGWLEAVDDPPLFVNTIGGLGSPWWKGGPPAGLVGEGSAAERGAAVIESILFMLRANLDAIAETGREVRALRVGGGLAQLDGLCTRLAALTGLPVDRPPEIEATALGAAWLALDGPETWETPPAARFEADPDPALEARYARYLDAVGRWSAR